MLNSDKYTFADFTTENYKKLLVMAKEKYVFRFFTDNLVMESKNIFWRHDVDFSMHRALKMAQIEADLGIKTTYCVLLHSEFYNLLEKEVSDVLRKIIALGHDIGLHFDSHYYDIKNESELDDKLILEKNIIEKVFSITINCFSFHITNEFTLSCNNEMYAGLVNCFSRKFISQYEYCSDSNGYWRHKRLEDVLMNSTNNNLQVLTHPELWQDEIMSPRKRVYRCIEGRAEATKKWYDEVLKKNNRENIDW